MKKLSYIVATFVTITFYFTICACGNGKKSETKENEEVLPEDIVEMRYDQIAMAGIDTSTVQMRSLSGILNVNGVVSASPQNLATVCAPYGGYVKSTQLIPGMFVSKGQTLVVLENQEFVELQKEYLEAKNKLEYAEAELKRHSELYKENVYSEKNVQQVTTEYKTQKAEKNALEQKLLLIGVNPAKLTEDNISSSVGVTSPIAGYVKSVNVNLGKNVSPSDVMVEIVNSDKLLLELTLFEKNINKVETGQKIHFFINDETEEHNAEVYQIGKSISDDKSYKDYALIQSGCKNILPGMYVSAKIEASSDQVSSVPSDAVVNFEDKDYIFVFEKNKVEGGKNFTEYKMIEVKKGVSDGTFTEITLPDGIDLKSLKVVVKGAYNLLSAKKNAGEMSC